ncbi:MAG: AraC family transcriptional regulator [Lachnospiraceae bacterium]|nr:AraC family transcriptional regulator [Lachnospiraceae bacterium]
MIEKKALINKEALPISASQKKVNDIISYLTQHLRNNPTISELASHFYLHPDYLARLFKKHMHISLGHYIMLQKISAAESLLREGMTVTEVQEYLNYSSYSYFFRTFQRITGISPSRYRSLSIDYN